MNIRRALAEFFPNLKTIEAPGTVDGGDVCEAGNNFFIGISERTNEAGASQLAALLAPFGYTCSLVDIQNENSLLHLKSGLAYLGENRLVVTAALAARAEFAGYDRIVVNDAEAYAANCVRVNDYVLVAAGYPDICRKVARAGLSNHRAGDDRV